MNMYSPELRCFVADQVLDTPVVHRGEDNNDEIGFADRNRQTAFECLFFCILMSNTEFIYCA